MVCPQCGSENTQRLAVVYEQGLSHITTMSRTRVRPILGLLPIASAKTKTRGIAMTATARKAAPPVKRGYRRPVTAILIGVAVLLIAHYLGAIGWIFGFALIGGFGWILYSFIRYNTIAWPAQYQAWEREWMCNKCGTVYEE